MERVIDLSDEPAALSVRYGQLLIKRGGKTDSVPLEDLLVLVVSHPAVCYTHAVLNGICAAGGAFILCNEKRLPAGMLLPLAGHFILSERLAAQAEATMPMKKFIWRQIVRAKILAQARLLRRLSGTDLGLEQLADEVKSGDSSNLESQASRRYWPALFGSAFRRDANGNDSTNILLNYGYGILRAVTARALCAAGLHPSIGVHHHNRYDPFCLADDLMEPFRPLIDDAVVQLTERGTKETALDKQSKAVLIGRIAVQRFPYQGEARRLFDILERIASAVASVLSGKRQKLNLPILKDETEVSF